MLIVVDSGGGDGDDYRDVGEGGNGYDHNDGGGKCGSSE